VKISGYGEGALTFQAVQHRMKKERGVIKKNPEFLFDALVGLTVGTMVPGSADVVIQAICTKGAQETRDC
jgi:hypothetical protein